MKLIRVTLFNLGDGPLVQRTPNFGLKRYKTDETHPAIPQDTSSDNCSLYHLS